MGTLVLMVGVSKRTVLSAPSSLALLSAVAFALSVGGCGEPTAKTTVVDATADQVPTPAAVDSDAPRFEVRVEAPVKTSAGKEALAKVHVEPQKPWHMNTDFPAALRIEAADGVQLEIPKQRSGDAERYDDDGLVFALPFTGKTKGSKRIAGEIDFAVCGDAACAPETVAVDFVVEVGCGTDALC